MRAVKEIWQLAISPGILPATLLLIPVGLYWIIGLMGLFDLNLDGADSIDLDVNGDGEIDSSDGFLPGLMSSVLKIVNASDIPLMLVISLISVLLWGSMMIGTMIVGVGSFLAGWPLALISLVVAILLCRFAVMPLKPFFRRMREEEEHHEPVIGRTGVVRSGELTDQFGQVEVSDKHGPMLLNARLSLGDAPITRGQEVLVFDFDQASGIYYVRSL